MIDHLMVRVRDFERSKKFYLAALAPLGYSVIMEFPGMCGFGEQGKPDFWIAQSDQATPAHVAFAATSRKQVDEFHRAALAAGGEDNGPPGLRKDYHPHYYGAFVFDPDRHNIEVVIHKPQ
jgi:catechol 2,3-dioxygenase-like lactoylglutathione lyase family enzyme